MKPVASHRIELLLIAGLLGLGVAPWPAVSWAVGPLRDNVLNLHDTERMERGYYENLLDAQGSRNAPSVSAELPPPDRRSLPRVAMASGPMITPVADLREYTLTPGFVEPARFGRWTNNGWGLRDREHTRRKPAGTRRIALLGDSIGAGWGVEDGAGFEPRLETALDSWSQASGGPAIEILNFAVPGHAPGQRWEQFVRLGGWETRPDLLLYEATPADPGWDDRRLRVLLPQGLGWDAPQYREVLDRAGIVPTMSREALKRRLSSHRWELLEAVYHSITGACQAWGIPSVWVLLPRIGRPSDDGERRRLVELARRSGFTHVFDLSDVFDGREPETIAVSPRDYHPNTAGHARIASRLIEIFTAEPGRIAWPDRDAKSGVCR